MKKFLAICLFLLFYTGMGFAQNRSGLGIHASGFDYAGPITGNYLFHDRVEESNGNGSGTIEMKKRLLWRPGARLGYYKELNRFFDLNLGLSLTNIEIPLSETDNTYEARLLYDNNQRRELYIGGDIRVNFNILDKTRYIVTPYLFAGITPTYKDNGYGYSYMTASVPLGLGFNFNVGRDIDLQLESGYRVAIGNKEYNHLQHSAGMIFWFGKPGDVPPFAAMTPIDTDSDGVPDAEDECPTIPGKAAFSGCPDSDNDGVPDHQDECPMVAGAPEFNGCPDSDGDGIPDHKDKCPYEAGTADRDGCPVPDRDGDGFNDEVDKCPDQYSKTNNGCPEIRMEIIQEVNKAAREIFFQTGKATLTKGSHSQLDRIVQVLKDDTKLYADIEGHTDNTGSDAINQPLSEKRAAVVREYLISKGIDAGRLTSQGFGSSQPVADNKTAAGRAQNRRTAINLRNYKK